MVARAGGLLTSRRLMDSVVFDLCRGLGSVAQVVCSRSRARIERSSKRQEKKNHHAPTTGLAPAASSQGSAHSSLTDST
jgi:hypothetical protein